MAKKIFWGLAFWGLDEAYRLLGLWDVFMVMVPDILADVVDIIMDAWPVVMASIMAFLALAKEAGVAVAGMALALALALAGIVVVISRRARDAWAWREELLKEGR